MSARRRFLRALLALAVATASAVTAAQPPATHELDGAALLAALRGGGYVIYFRHASTDFGHNDEQMSGYGDCAKQRNLTDAGRDEARAIGAAIRELDIPVGDVLASPFCRTMETARLAFGRASATPAVRGGPASAEAGRYDELKALLAEPVPKGTNIVVVSHGNPYRAVVGGPYLAEGEAAVVEPLGERGFRVVARVAKDRWRALAARPA